MNSSFAKLSFLALPLIAFSACQDYDPLGEEGLQHLQNQKALEAAINEYTKNFEARYGKIDPNHDWGMMLTVNPDAGTRATVDNRNEWVVRYHLNVPGWPDDYYDTSGTKHTENGYHYLNSSGLEAQYSGSGAVPSGSHPAGDVTDEEIQYVSWWFRTHRYPTSIALHWTDFFVQGISADNDRYMSGDNQGKIVSDLERYQKNNGNWEQVSGDQNVTYTIDYFSAEMLQPDPGASDGGWDHIKNYNRQNSNCINGEETLYVGSEANDYIYNLDGSYKSTYPIDNRLIAFYESSGTENFRAHYSQNSMDLDVNVEYNVDGSVKTHPTHEGHNCGLDNNTDHRSWVLVELDFYGPSGRHYHGYYLAFDYQIFKEEEGTAADGTLSKYTLHKADGYYSNWIFKISPAMPTNEVAYTGLSRRIMCEDLGNTFDFDFNDIVFDATYNITEAEYAEYLDGSLTQSPIDVTIRLQASGGTLPIWAGVDGDRNLPQTFEAHHLLGGNPSSRPVNVNAPGGADGMPVAIYHYKLEFPQNLSTQEDRQQALSLNRIPIYVSDNGNKGTYLTNSTSPWADEYTQNSHPSPTNKGNKVAPRAFGVPVGVSWMKECKFIEDSYTLFDDWVRDMNTYGDNATDPNKTWYMGGIADQTQIYAYTPYVKPTGNSVVIKDIDYSQYGTKMSQLIEKDEFENVYHYIDFNEFPKDPESQKLSGKYNLTIVCRAKNSEPGIQNGKLIRVYKGQDGFWQSENNKDITPTSNKCDHYEDLKLYTLTFVVDLNEDFFDEYTHFWVDNVYSHGTDTASDIYIMRIGESTQTGGGSAEYPEYGKKAEYSLSKDEYTNPHCYIDLSSFDNQTNGVYTVSFVCQSQNDPSQFQPTLQLSLVGGPYPKDLNSNPTSHQYSVIDSGNNMVLVQIQIQFPLYNDGDTNNYTGMEVKNIFNGLNPNPSVLDAIKDIRISTAQ